MSDPIDEIRRICNDAGDDLLNRISTVLGFDNIEAELQAEIERMNKELEIEYAKVEQLRAEVARLASVMAYEREYLGGVQTVLDEVRAERDQLKSWQESVLDEVGQEPRPEDYGATFDGVYHDWKHVLFADKMGASDEVLADLMGRQLAYFKHHAEHLAAKLVEAQSCEVDAKRYRWLRDGNAYAPEEEMVRGGDELDKLCDEGMQPQPLPDERSASQKMRDAGFIPSKRTPTADWQDPDFNIEPDQSTEKLPEKQQ